MRRRLLQRIEGTLWVFLRQRMGFRIRTEPGWRRRVAATRAYSCGRRRLVADAAFDGGVAFAGVDDDFLFFAFLVVDD